MIFNQSIIQPDFSRCCPKCGSKQVVDLGRSDQYPFDYLRQCLWCRFGFKEPARSEARNLGLWRAASHDEIE